MKPIKCFVIVMYSILCFGIIITISYNNNMNTLKKTSNLFYSENSLFFTSSSEKLDYEKILNRLPTNTVLYSALLSESDIRGIMIEGDVTIPELESGRFFSEIDFQNSDTRLAVVGNQVETTIYNGKEVIYFDEEPYEIIGIIGYSMPTRLDMTIMLSMNKELLEVEHTRFIIDGNAIQANYDFLGNEDIWDQVIVYENTNENILHIIDTGNNQVVTSVFFISLLMFNTLLLVWFLIGNRKNEMIIKKMNGFSNKNLLTDGLKELTKILISGLFIGSMVSCVLGRGKYGITILSLGVSYGTIITLSIVCFNIIIKNQIRSINQKKLGVLN